MRRILRFLPALMIVAIPVIACGVTADRLLPRIDAVLASDDGTTGVETAQPVDPAIHAFYVVPGRGIAVGDSLTATWVSAGGPVELCLVQLLPAGGSERCFDGLAETGSLGIRVDEKLGGPLAVRLEVAPGQPNAVAEAVEIGYQCDHSWFTEPEVVHCPETAVYITPAAAQPYAHGWLIWVDEPGRYIALTDSPVSVGGVEKRYLSAWDPLIPTRDTADSVNPPEELYAPLSVFGLIWRGDASGADGYRDLLGWATAPEFGYTARYQCDRSETPWQYCYVTHPEGWVVVLHPNGYWYPADTLRGES